MDQNNRRNSGPSNRDFGDLDKNIRDRSDDIKIHQDASREGTSRDDDRTDRSRSRDSEDPMTPSRTRDRRS